MEGLGHTFLEALWLPRGLERKCNSEAHYLVMPYMLPLGYVNTASRDTEYETGGNFQWRNNSNTLRERCDKCRNCTGIQFRKSTHAKVDMNSVIELF